MPRPRWGKSQASGRSPAFGSKAPRLPQQKAPTSSSLGPGTYTPEDGKARTEEREKAHGCAGASSYPFSSSQARASLLDGSNADARYVWVVSGPKDA